MSSNIMSIITASVLITTGPIYLLWWLEENCEHQCISDFFFGGGALRVNCDFSSLHNFCHKVSKSQIFSSHYFPSILPKSSTKCGRTLQPLHILWVKANLSPLKLLVRLGIWSISNVGFLYIFFFFVPSGDDGALIQTLVSQRVKQQN